MNSLNKEQKQKYQKYVKEVTPTYSLPLEMGKAFLTGGLICVLGQFLINTGLSMGLEEEAAGTWCSILLVLLSVLLTGFNLYPSIANGAEPALSFPSPGLPTALPQPPSNTRRKDKSSESVPRSSPSPVPLFFTVLSPPGFWD